MREILFRGKMIHNDEWKEGYLVGPNHIGDWVTCEPIHPETVGQFTGLTDKNGKRVFEGDIVKVTDDYGETDFSDGGIGDVGFYDGLWYVSGEVNNGLNDLTKVYYVKVIGNIHDNPELLEVKNA